MKFQQDQMNIMEVKNKYFKTVIFKEVFVS